MTATVAGSAGADRSGVRRSRPRDVVVRALVLLQVALLVVAVYAAVVFGLGRLLGRGSDDLVMQVVAATLAAVVLAPARARALQLANRAVHGQRASPFQVLAEITDQMGDAVAEAEALDRLAALLAAGTGAATATVWVRSGTEMQPAALWPEGTARPPTVPLTELADPDLPGADAVALVRDGSSGAVVGALGLQTARDTLSAQQERVLEDLAAAAGLLLRRVRLDAELAARVEELRTSRRRLVEAQDAARRQLERDLHDGAQQQLLTLKVGLALARALAAKEGAPELATELGDLARHADAAIEELRAVAHGIYPPLLVAEGLGSALTALGRRPVFAVTVAAPGLGRYPEHVEATAYFAAAHLLEALTGPMPEPVALVAVETGGALVLGVTAPGAALDTAGLSDRIAAIDGTVEDRGDRVTMRLPLRQPEPSR